MCSNGNSVFFKTLVSNFFSTYIVKMLRRLLKSRVSRMSKKKREKDDSLLLHKNDYANYRFDCVSTNCIFRKQNFDT